MPLFETSLSSVRGEYELNKNTTIVLKLLANHIMNAMHKKSLPGLGERDANFVWRVMTADLRVPSHEANNFVKSSEKYPVSLTLMLIKVLQ